MATGILASNFNSLMMGRPNAGRRITYNGQQIKKEKPLNELLTTPYYLTAMDGLKIVADQLKRQPPQTNKLSLSKQIDVDENSPENKIVIAKIDGIFFKIQNTVSSGSFDSKTVAICYELVMLFEQNAYKFNDSIIDLYIKKIDDIFSVIETDEDYKILIFGKKQSDLKNYATYLTTLLDYIKYDILDYLKKFSDATPADKKLILEQKIRSKKRENINKNVIKTLKDDILKKMTPEKRRELEQEMKRLEDMRREEMKKLEDIKKHKESFAESGYTERDTSFDAFSPIPKSGPSVTMDEDTKADLETKEDTDLETKEDTEEEKAIKLTQINIMRKSFKDVNDYYNMYKQGELRPEEMLNAIKTALETLNTIDLNVVDIREYTEISVDIYGIYLMIMDAEGESMRSYLYSDHRGNEIESIYSNIKEKLYDHHIRQLLNRSTTIEKDIRETTEIELKNERESSRGIRLDKELITSYNISNIIIQWEREKEVILDRIQRYNFASFAKDLSEYEKNINKDIDSVRKRLTNILVELDTENTEEKRAIANDLERKLDELSRKKRIIGEIFADFTNIVEENERTARGLIDMYEENPDNFEEVLKHVTTAKLIAGKLNILNTINFPFDDGTPIREAKLLLKVYEKEIKRRKGLLTERSKTRTEQLRKMREEKEKKEKELEKLKRKKKEMIEGKTEYTEGFYPQAPKLNVGQLFDEGNYQLFAIYAYFQDNEEALRDIYRAIKYEYMTTRQLLQLVIKSTAVVELKYFDAQKKEGVLKFTGNKIMQGNATIFGNASRIKSILRKFFNDQNAYVGTLQEDLLQILKDKIRESVMRREPEITLISK